MMNEDTALVLVLDEIDEMAPIGGVRPPARSEFSAGAWIIRTLKWIRDAGRACLVLGLTDYPDICSDNIRSEIGPYIYLGALEEETIQKITESKHPEAAADVAGEYIRVSREHRRIPMIRPLVEALNLYEGLPTESKQVSEPTLVAKHLFHLWMPPTEVSFEAYENQHKEHIEAVRSVQALPGV